MNIGIGKIGKAIKFNSNSWNAVGGDIDAPTLFMLWASTHPEHTFYLLSKSDYSRAKNIDRLPNIVDVWEFADKDMNDVEKRDFLLNDLEDIVIDFAVLYSGPLGRGNIVEFTPVVDGSRLTKCLGYQINYTSPILHYLNTTGLPWFMISVDSRYFPQLCVDMINLPMMSYAQMNLVGKYKRFKDMESVDKNIIVKDEVPAFYSGVETLYLTTKVKLSWDDYLRPRQGMNIILNEGGNRGLERGPYLKEYVLDYLDDVSIFGKWREPWISDDRFKGPVHIHELEEMLLKTKYTFMIPIGKGWATAKYWEMAHYGVLPFFHPWYDTQCNIPAPDFLRVSSPNELWDRIDQLNADDQLYENILRAVYETLLEEYYDGSYLNKLLNHMVGQINGSVELPTK